MRRWIGWAAGLTLLAAGLRAEEPRSKVQRIDEEAAAPQGYLGVSLAEVEPEERKDYGLAEDQAAMVVLEVTKGGPAEKAGLKAGDLILAVNGKAHETREAVVEAVRACAPGTPVALKILREGKEQTLEAKAGQAPVAAAGPRRGNPAEMKRMQEQMLAQMPPEVREKFEAMQKKAAELQKKYKEQGLSPEEIQTKLQEELKSDIEDLQRSLQGGGE